MMCAQVWGVTDFECCSSQYPVFFRETMLSSVEGIFACVCKWVQSSRWGSQPTPPYVSHRKSNGGHLPVAICLLIGGTPRKYESYLVRYALGMGKAGGESGLLVNSTSLLAIKGSFRWIYYWLVCRITRRNVFLLVQVNYWRPRLTCTAMLDKPEFWHLVVSAWARPLDKWSRNEKVDF